MPELPEVETIRRGLEKKIIGLTISDIQILNPKSFIGDPKLLIGAEVVGVFRRAKMLGIEISLSHSVYRRKSDKKDIRQKAVDDEQSSSTNKRLALLFHLKMSGQVILQGESVKRKGESEGKFIGGHPTKDMLGELPNKSTRIIFTLKNLKAVDGSQKTFLLFFNDQRKFGWVKVIQNSELKMQNEKLFANLGPEPLEKEFTLEVFKRQLSKRKNTSVKVALLDQQVISGIGNIYASEACFLAKIHPTRKVSELSDTDFKNLRNAVIGSLENGIKYGGSTKTHFVNAEGKKGLFLEHAYVYSREGSPCKICQTKLEKIRLGGRGTVYCPKCQV